MYAGPGPELGTPHEPALHGIAMDVPDLAIEFGFRAHVPIEYSAALPEPGLAVRVDDPAEDRGAELDPSCQDLTRDTDLEGAQRGLEPDRWGRAAEKVDMLGHDDPSEDRQTVAGTQSLKAAGKELTDAWIGEEWQPPVAREGQETDAVGHLHATHPLSDGSLGHRHNVPEREGASKSSERL